MSADRIYVAQSLLLYGAIGAVLLAGALKIERRVDAWWHRRRWSR